MEYLYNTKLYICINDTLFDYHYPPTCIILCLYITYNHPKKNIIKQKNKVN